jgi:nicotinamide mononucleotide transporter
MMDLLSGMALWEGIAVILAIAYLLLATRENILCWACALISASIYTILFWRVSLLMESALNVYYMVMAVYGWYQWRYGGANHGTRQIGTLTGSQHLLIIAGVLLLAGINGYLLSNHTQAAWPYIDSFTTWASVITTVMVAKKILENWLYWVVIDAISIVLYLDRGLSLTALLFAAYVIIAVIGFLSWRRRQADQPAMANA